MSSFEEFLLSAIKNTFDVLELQLLKLSTNLNNSEDFLEDELKYKKNPNLLSGHRKGPRRVFFTTKD